MLLVGSKEKGKKFNCTTQSILVFCTPVNAEFILPQARSRDECGVDVRFTYDENGILQVEATVLKTQQTPTLIIQDNPGVLSEHEIAWRLAELADLKIHPRDRLEIRTLLGP